jgi:hypothetical protein
VTHTGILTKKPEHFENTSLGRAVISVRPYFHSPQPIIARSIGARSGSRAVGHCARRRPSNFPGRPYAASTGAGAPHPAQHLTDGAVPSVECRKLGHGKGAVAVAPGPDLRHTANRCGGRSACVTESRRSKAGSLWIGVEPVCQAGNRLPPPVWRHLCYPLPTTVAAAGWSP